MESAFKPFDQKQPKNMGEIISKEKISEANFFFENHKYTRTAYLGPGIVAQSFPHSIRKGDLEETFDDFEEFVKAALRLNPDVSSWKSESAEYLGEYKYHGTRCPVWKDWWGDRWGDKFYVEAPGLGSNWEEGRKSRVIYTLPQKEYTLSPEELEAAENTMTDKQKTASRKREEEIDRMYGEYRKGKDKYPEFWNKTRAYFEALQPSEAKRAKEILEQLGFRPISYEEHEDGRVDMELQYGKVNVRETFDGIIVGQSTSYDGEEDEGPKFVFTLLVRNPGDPRPYYVQSPEDNPYWDKFQEAQKKLKETGLLKKA